MTRLQKSYVSVSFIIIQLLIIWYCADAVISWGDRTGSGMPDMEWGVLWQSVAGMSGMAVFILLTRVRKVDLPTAAFRGILADILATVAIIPVYTAYMLLMESVTRNGSPLYRSMEWTVFPVTGLITSGLALLWYRGKE